LNLFCCVVIVCALMKNWNGCSIVFRGVVKLLVVGFLLAGVIAAEAQPTILSSVPANFATGVSPSASVVFTFSEAMDPDLTSAQFIDGTTFSFYATTETWSSGNTVLTCTPITPFASGRQIYWSVDGENTSGDPLSGTTAGLFTTGSGGGGGTGSGTNAITTFNLGKTYNYNQNSTAAPVLDTDVPYLFSASTTLASNRTATSVTLKLPSAAVTNLSQNILQHENYYLVYFETNLSSFDAAFPAGSYQFSVQAATSNQQVNVTLSAPASQPAAPHVANYAAAQAVNASQNFTLSWDAFPGGTAADYIYVTVGNNVFATASPGVSGALTGTATSVVIPAGRLQAGANYTASVGFYRASWSTNASYVAGTFRGTVTEFPLVTTGGVVVHPTLGNVSLSGGKVGFDVSAGSSVAFTVEYATSLTPANWQSLITTNMVGGTIHLVDPRPVTDKAVFYRVRVN
jgi:Bacterial Ig-like domain